MGRALGRLKPPDWQHVEKYPLTALAADQRPAHVPVSIGVNWYTAFDSPIEQPDGSYRLPDVAKGEQLGTVRGGHCVCLRPPALSDPDGCWQRYNQGQEGACEGFGHARVFSLLYGGLFDAFWLYDDARRAEGTFPSGEGSTNRAVLQALVKWGVHTSHDPSQRDPWRTNAPGRFPIVKTYRWATTATDVLAVLGATAGDAILLNSWGTEYPRQVLLPGATLDRLLREEGEADVITEK